MQVLLTFPEADAARLLAFLDRNPTFQLTPTGGRARVRRPAPPAAHTTEQLLSNPVRERLLAAVERARQGKYELHDLIED